MNTPIKAVIFDCFGVLYHGSLSYLLELTPPQHREEMRDLAISSDYGYITREEYLSRAGQMVDREPREIEAVIDSRHTRHEELFALVLELKSRYKTAMLSNVGSEVMDRLFAADELTQYFDTVVLSSDIGMVKPNPEIFEYTANQLGLQPGECVMIDDLEKNCIGAQATGMTAIQYESYEQLTNELAKIGVVSAGTA